MDILAWVLAVVIAAFAWKFLKGLLKLAFFVVAVLLIASQLYPYISAMLGNLA